MSNTNTFETEQYEETDANLESLINFKFSVEREYEALTEVLKKLEGMNWKNMVTSDLEMYSKLSLYRTSMEPLGSQFLEKQKTLIGDINEILMKKCRHNWINDVIDEPFSSRNICYCSKCYMYTKK